VHPDSNRVGGGRKVWILTFGSAEGVLLGPVQRVIRMGRMARDAGFRPVLAFEQGLDGVLEGMEKRRLSRALVDEIRPEDAVVASGMIDYRTLKELLDRGIGFDCDLYGLPALEHIEIDHGDLPARKLYQSRRRLRLRLKFLLRAAERIYLSNAEQLAFLGGMLFPGSDLESTRLASRLPAKTLLLPMGMPEAAALGTGNPFPPEFQGRPVFLWGGGIWSWFDTSTLLEAFRLLADRGSPAALYFVCGTNPSGLSTQDGPVERTWARARDLDLLGRNVAFHDGPVDGADLPAYLEHCAAAIMSNPSHLESVCSWRTRLLDAPPYGKPVVVSGFDPLSSRMVDAGAALSSSSGDPAALAGAIDRFCSDPELRRRMGERSSALARELSWDAVFDPWIRRLADPHAFRGARHRLGLFEKLAFVLGA
jgi:glycosyltransferase involved in cell wall biosynthesis